MSDFIKQEGINIEYNEDSWIILNQIEKSIKDKIEKYGTPLKDWDINIYRGVLTGCNEAFIIDGSTKDELIKQDPKSAEIIRPILRGRDIKRYSYNFADKWLIYIPWHFPLHEDKSINGVSEQAENLFKTNYPAIYKHLLQFKEILENRNKAETGIRYEWYALQRYGSNYMDDFNKQKIMYSEIVKSPQFYLDKKGEFYPEATTFIITGKNLEYLLIALNSKFFAYIFKKFYSGGGLGNNGYRYKKAFIDKLPIIKLNKEKYDMIKVSSKIDNIFYNSYMLSDEEIEYIEQNTTNL